MESWPIFKSATIASHYRARTGADQDLHADPRFLLGLSLTNDWATVSFSAHERFDVTQAVSD